MPRHERRAARPGSRSRRRGPATRRWPTYQSISAARRGAEAHRRDLDAVGGELAVLGERDRRRPPRGAARQARDELARLRRRRRGLPRMSPSSATSVSAPSTSVAGAPAERLAARVLLARPRRGSPCVCAPRRPAGGPRTGCRPARGSRAAAATPRRGSGRSSVSGLRGLKSGKNSAASRCRTRASPSRGPCSVPTSIAKSPRIEPGAASSGLVAPITWRAALTASSPSSTSATSGPEVMNSTSSPKNGLPVVLGVVLLGQVLGRPSCARSATIRRPLRSKRAMISPVRPRANASGLTRISVRSMAGSVSASSAARRLARAAASPARRSAAPRRRPSTGPSSGGGGGAWRTASARSSRPRRTGRCATRGRSACAHE